MIQRIFVVGLVISWLGIVAIAAASSALAGLAIFSLGCIVGLVACDGASFEDF
jgi:hypothetical protein